MKHLPPFRYSSCFLLILLTLPLSTHAQEQTETGEDDVFTLGRITVTAPKKDDPGTSSTSRVSSEQMKDLDKNSLPEALNTIPGVITTAGSGSRNESLISVRGFDRWQVPLLMDGIRLYLPADNRIDFDRFLTPDLSEIQVSKGYVSVLNGPDGMGGAINLVTRKPVKSLEGEVMTSFALGDNGQLNGNTSYVDLGGREEKYYFQVSAEQREVNRWRVSGDFTPTEAENGGDRDHSDKRDTRLNLKFGITPNSTDEYSLNFVKQKGDKHGVGSVTGTSSISTWDWPKWDTWSTYWLSHTELAWQSYLNTKVYYNKFVNDLVGYSDTSLTTKRWTSYYDDYAEGISTEVGTDALSSQTLKAALHFRRDHHSEWQVTESSGFTEPTQKTVEDVYSAAVEDTWHIRQDVDLVAGLSRDIRRSHESQEYASSTGLFNQPVSNSYATNYQTAAIYRYSQTGKLHASFSDRTRFPTIFERFSSRFGGALSNPWLQPERARNYEIGVEDNLRTNTRASFSIFHSDVEDAIQSINVVYEGSTYSQNQNIGDATYDGFELGLTSFVGDTLELHGNYSYIATKLHNPNDTATRLTTTPQHKIFTYAKWTPTARLAVIPSIEYASPRWSDSADGDSYVRTGEYTLVGLKITYHLTSAWETSLSGNNLLDSDYQVSDGYPQQGRNYLLSTRYKF